MPQPDLMLLMYLQMVPTAEPALAAVNKAINARLQRWRRLQLVFAFNINAIDNVAIKVGIILMMDGQGRVSSRW